MRSTLQLIVLVFFSFFLFLLSVTAFNFLVDPMCYYRCTGINLFQRSENVYYKSAQTAVANPQAELLVLGSSRGERISPLWLEDVTGLKSINLSQGGADVLLKIALLNIAIDSKVPVKKVLWMADFFELARAATDIKTRQTPILRHFSGLEESSWGVSYWVERLQSLIDRKTFDASLALLRDSSAEIFPKEGNGIEIDFQKCQEKDFGSDVNPEYFRKMVANSYGVFGQTALQILDDTYWEIFKKQVAILKEKEIDLTIVIPPYHPDLEARLFAAHPKWRERRQIWINGLQDLADSTVHIFDYTKGLAQDDHGPRYWEDGVHPTCYSNIEMLKPAFAN